MTIHFLIVLISALILLSGIVLGLKATYRQYQQTKRNGGRNNDHDDGQGGIPWDFDAPLDLPPGVYVLPPEPAPSTNQ